MVYLPLLRFRALKALERLGAAKACVVYSGNPTSR